MKIKGAFRFPKGTCLKPIVTAWDRRQIPPLFPICGGMLMSIVLEPTIRVLIFAPMSNRQPAMKGWMTFNIAIWMGWDSFHVSLMPGTISVAIFYLFSLYLKHIVCNIEQTDETFLHCSTCVPTSILIIPFQSSLKYVIHEEV